VAASLDQAAVNALNDALRKRAARSMADSTYADAYLRFLRDARAAGWSWPRIGRGLGLTAKAVEMYWKRNGMRAGRLGDAPTQAR
jgi:hypothetical protein